MPATAERAGRHPARAGLTPQQLLACLAFGGVRALMAFGLSVASLSMLLQRKVDFATAPVTRFGATRLNFPVMELWGALIAGLMQPESRPVSLPQQ